MKDDSIRIYPANRYYQLGIYKKNTNSYTGITRWFYCTAQCCIGAYCGPDSVRIDDTYSPDMVESTLGANQNPNTA